MSYSVEYAKRGLKDLAKLDRKTQTLILRWIARNLVDCENPRAVPHAKKLEGVPDGWRWRAGTYRILGRIIDNRVVIELFRIGHRQGVYHNLLNA